MSCPNCGHWDAYTGLLWVHCRNSDCRYYDVRYDEKRIREELGIPLEELDESPPERLKRLRKMMAEKPRPS